jgi:hypothetical protein
MWGSVYTVSSPDFASLHPGYEATPVNRRGGLKHAAAIQRTEKLNVFATPVFDPIGGKSYKRA